MSRRGSGEARKIDWADLRSRLASVAAQTSENEERAAARAAEILRERALVLARTPPATDGDGALEVLQFTLSGERYAIAAAYVRQVVPAAMVSRIPSAPPFLSGITCVRGELLPVIDLRVVLKLDRDGAGGGSRLLVLGRERSELGFFADDADHIGTVRLHELSPPPAVLTGETRHYLAGVAPGPLFVLAGQVLLEDPQLFIDQGEE